jgi:hypothetical protein
MQCSAATACVAPRLLYIPLPLIHTDFPACALSSFFSAALTTTPLQSATSLATPSVALPQPSPAEPRATTTTSLHIPSRCMRSTSPASLYLCSATSLLRSTRRALRPTLLLAPPSTVTRLLDHTPSRFALLMVPLLLAVSSQMLECVPQLLHSATSQWVLEERLLRSAGSLVLARMRVTPLLLCSTFLPQTTASCRAASRLLLHVSILSLGCMYTLSAVDCMLCASPAGKIDVPVHVWQQSTVEPLTQGNPFQTFANF